LSEFCRDRWSSVTRKSRGTGARDRGDRPETGSDATDYMGVSLHDVERPIRIESDLMRCGE
jgi:hypothetical protein